MIKQATKYILIPLIFPLIFFLVASTPVQVLGCLTRGLIAVSISFVSVLGALTFAAVGLKQRLSKEQASPWWLISTMILSVPALYIIFISF